MCPARCSQFAVGSAIASFPCSIQCKKRDRAKHANQQNQRVHGCQIAQPEKPEQAKGEQRRFHAIEKLEGGQRSPRFGQQFRKDAGGWNSHQADKRQQEIQGDLSASSIGNQRHAPKQRHAQVENRQQRGIEQPKENGEEHGCRVSGVGCRVSGVGCRVSGGGCRDARSRVSTKREAKGRRF
ncbi:MAG: hypothetical protein HC895_04905 [Leptolyngbyaceae cyanobacterium SM1_3_5]|nr:hypothetical protein [Leptolyngbyaceae cyanobacterium SM1_3_5]